jgi:alcohol dehydrogenase
MRYKAAVLVSPEQLEIEEQEMKLVGPEEALVEVACCGICGTDLAIYSGNYKVCLPQILGHEFSGDVIEVGSRKYTSWVGKSVTAEINNTCISYNRQERCGACARKLPNHCQRRTVTGIIGADGAFAEFIVVPVRNLHELPSGIAPTEGVFVEPLAAALQTFELTPLVKGSQVVVLGLGRLGLLISIVARARGAEVIGIDRNEEKRVRAARFGITVVNSENSAQWSAAVKEKTGGLGADVVVEATGSPAGVGMAMELVRARGVLALKSTPGETVKHLDVTRLVVNEIQLQGSRCGPFDRAIAFLLEHRPDVTSLISRTLPLTEIQEAFSVAPAESKVLIRC